MNENYSKGFGLIIGVGSDLPNTIEDAIGLSTILSDPERCAYPKEQVILLTRDHANRNNILDAFDHLAEITKEDSTVIVYFSGHGYSVKTTLGEAYYLMPFGYDINQLYKTAISGEELVKKINKINANKFVLLLDCCHAGGFVNSSTSGIELTKSPIPNEAISFFTQGSGKVLIASSKENELSYAGKPYSAFTLALLEALSGIGCSKQDGYVRITDLALHTREVVPQRTGQKQHPILDLEHADNFVIAYYAGGDSQSKGLPFEIEPVIELEPGSWTFNQKDQTIWGNQTNITGDGHGPILSGSFSGPVQVGKDKSK